MPRLTKRLIDQLTASGRDLFVWDSGLPGFGVRVLPSGRKTYLVQYRDTHGRTRRYALGAHGVLTPDQARSLAQEALAHVKAGENPSQERQAARQAATVGQLAARYELDMLPSLKGGDSGDGVPIPATLCCCPEGICWLGFRINNPRLGVLRGLLPQPAIPPGLMLSQAFNVSVCPTATMRLYPDRIG